MPHGPRILLLSALALTGCQSADKVKPNPLLPLRPAVNPTDAPRTPSGVVKTPTPATPTSASRPAPSPVVTNDNFQRPIADSGQPQPGVMPSMGVPTLGGTTTYPPPSAGLQPVAPPGSSLPPQPPTADGRGGDLKMPTLFDPK